MKLPNFLNDPELNELRASMGATELGMFRLSVNPYRITMAELEALIADSIDLRGWEELKALPDRTLAYKDRRVILHRRDVPVLGPGRARDHELPHFHLASCPIVRRLRDADMNARHAVSAREDGLFAVNLTRGPDIRPSLEALPVCEDCLGELAFDLCSPHSAASERRGALAGFSVPRFFEKFPRALSLDPPVR